MNICGDVSHQFKETPTFYLVNPHFPENTGAQTNCSCYIEKANNGGDTTTVITLRAVVVWLSWDPGCSENIKLSNGSVVETVCSGQGPLYNRNLTSIQLT